MARARLCTRPGCTGAATASLSFQYSTRTLWLDDLDDPDDRQPHHIELCGRHADRLCPPRGWTGQDRRSVARQPITRAAS